MDQRLTGTNFTGNSIDFADINADGNRDLIIGAEAGANEAYCLFGLN